MCGVEGGRISGRKSRHLPRGDRQRLSATAYHRTRTDAAHPFGIELCGAWRPYERASKPSPLCRGWRPACLSCCLSAVGAGRLRALRVTRGSHRSPRSWPNPKCHRAFCGTPKGRPAVDPDGAHKQSFSGPILIGTHHGMEASFVPLLFAANRRLGFCQFWPSDVAWELARTPSTTMQVLFQRLGSRSLLVSIIAPTVVDRTFHRSTGQAARRDSPLRLTSVVPR